MLQSKPKRQRKASTITTLPENEHGNLVGNGEQNVDIRVCIAFSAKKCLAVSVLEEPVLFVLGKAPQNYQGLIERSTTEDYTRQITNNIINYVKYVLVAYLLLSFGPCSLEQLGLPATSEVPVVSRSTRKCRLHYA